MPKGGLYNLKSLKSSDSQLLSSPIYKKQTFFSNKLKQYEQHLYSAGRNELTTWQMAQNDQKSTNGLNGGCDSEKDFLAEGSINGLS